MRTRVLFLDIDGVLKCRDDWRAKRKPREWSPERTAILNWLCAGTNAAVVMSSTWRMDSNCRRIMRANGFTGKFHPDWRTELPNHLAGGKLLSCRKRGDEIAEWLSRHPEVTAYAIVDDDSDMLDEQLPRFVKTDFEVGLTEEAAGRLADALRLAA